MCCSQLEAAHFYRNKRSKKGFPKSALGLKACFPRNQEKKMHKSMDGLDCLFLAGGIGGFVALQQFQV